MPTAISAVNELALLREKLVVLGFTTMEQLVGAATVARAELEQYLAVKLDELMARVPVALEQPSGEERAILADAVYTLGAEVDGIPPMTIAPAIAAPAVLPHSVNLIPGMPAVRNQRNRGTCVAFASIAVFEHYLQGAYQDMSEQFLYWNCKRSDGIPSSSGTYVSVAFPLLGRDGVCLEATWPYNPNPIAGNEGQAPPPPGAVVQALAYRPTTIKRIAPTSVLDIKAELAADRCVAFSVPVFNSWWNQAVSLSGDILMPIPGEVRTGGHAMCLVGYQDSPAEEPIGGGRFLLRNSWGTTWGLRNPNGAGYGTIPYAYISRFGMEAYTVL